MAAREHIEVWLDDSTLHPGPVKIGTLYPHDRRSDLPPSFAYDQDWLASPRSFQIDPQLPLVPGEIHAQNGSWFGVFLDVAPDRWGRVLMERREALQAHDEHRPVHALTDLDFMLGVSDLTRTGALRFKLHPEGPFIQHDDLHSVPPITSLAELASVAQELEDPHAEDRPEYRQWLSMLLAPGTSLGGARPKATFRDDTGQLWLAKFPSKNDRYDWGAWEYLTHKLAYACQIDLPLSSLHRLSSGYRTFSVQRFDRTPTHDPSAPARHLYVSAMTLLGRQDGEPGGSYLDLVQIIEDKGGHNIARDLKELFRRAVFNLLVGNRDDHLRNHGFIATPSGWRLAPAFDMNPNPDKREHALTWDGRVATPDLDALGETHSYYRLNRTDAMAMVEGIIKALVGWQEKARALGIAQREIQLMESVFLV